MDETAPPVHKTNGVTPAILIAIFFLGFGTVVSLQLWRTNQKEAAMRASPITIGVTPTPFSLRPPGEAVSGIFQETNGDVQKRSRDNGDLGVASPSAILVEGDSIITGVESTALVEYPGFLTLALSEKTEINTVNLMPDAMLFNQPYGTVAYANAPEKTFSIRSLHTLIESSGSATIDTENGIITLSQQSGASRLALIDLENNTQVWSLSEGQTATVDDLRRKVVIQ